MPFYISRTKLELEIAKRISDSCDQILTEMGAEIHDDLVQKLSVFRLHMDKMKLSSHDPMEIETLIIKMRNDFEHVIRAVKTISRRLLPSNMEGQSLVSLFEILCQNMEQPGTGNIHFEHSGATKLLEDNIQLHLLRIVQELIHNALKHSSAWHIWIRLKSEASHLTIEVEDDGTGSAKVHEFVSHLKKKNNTLKMRTRAIGATIDYLQGSKGLLARVSLKC